MSPPCTTIRATEEARDGLLRLAAALRLGSLREVLDLLGQVPDHPAALAAITTLLHGGSVQEATTTEE